MAKAQVGTVVALVAEKVVVPAYTGGLVALALVSEAEDDAPLAAPAHVGAFHTVVMESVVANSQVGGMFTLMLQNDQDLVIAEPTGSLLSQRQI